MFIWNGVLYLCNKQLVMNTRVNIEIAKLLDDKKYPYVFTTVGNVERVPLNIPTIVEVVMWLYETHGVWIECLHRGDMGDFTFKVSKLKKGWRTEPHYIHEKGFNSPTGVYESAIIYTLENLIKI